MKQALGILLVLAAFAATAWLTYTQAAPAAVIGWTIGLLGFGAVVLLFTLRHQIIVSKPTQAELAPTEPAAAVSAEAGSAEPAPARAEAAPVALKQGNDYRVDVDDEKFSLTNLRTGEVSSLAWADITAVCIVAVEGFPAGDVSYVVHGGERPVEVPLGAIGNEAFLATMQEKLDDFDNAALIEGMAMTHGFKQVWPAQPESAAPTPAPVSG